MIWKLTLVSVNGRSVFVYLPIVVDGPLHGRVRIQQSVVKRVFGLDRGCCISFR